MKTNSNLSQTMKKELDKLSELIQLKDNKLNSLTQKLNELNAENIILLKQKDENELGYNELINENRRNNCYIWNNFLILFF